MEIRKAGYSDLSDMVSLMNHLGYPTTLKNMEERWSKMNSHPDYSTFVAIVDGKAIGMIGLQKGLLYESDGEYVRILVLIVDLSYRKNGVGKNLLAFAEKWAKGEGASSMAVNSGNRKERIPSHQFYLNKGYTKKSIGFIKRV